MESSRGSLFVFVVVALLVAVCPQQVLSQIQVRLQREDGIPSTPADQPQTPINSPVALFLFEKVDYFDPVPFECRLDSGAWQACSSPHQVGPLGDGTHTFDVRVPGNPMASDTWVIDTINPTLTFVNRPALVSGTGAVASFSLAADEAVQFFCDVDGTMFPCSQDNVTSHTENYGPLEDGRYAFRARAVDLAGNESPTALYEYSIDQCMLTSECKASDCLLASTNCTCGPAFFLELNNDHICRSCRSLAGCVASQLHCTNGIDSICGDCDSYHMVDDKENYVDCRVVSLWGQP